MTPDEIRTRAGLAGYRPEPADLDVWNSAGGYLLVQMIGMFPLVLSAHETLDEAQAARRAEVMRHVH